MTIELQIFKRACKLMGNRFELSVVGTDELCANEKIDIGIAEIQRIEKLLTTFSEDSQTNQVNANAGISPVIVSLETFNLIHRSLRISSLTLGSFYISYCSVDNRLWNFYQHMTDLPDNDTAM